MKAVWPDPFGDASGLGEASHHSELRPPEMLGAEVNYLRDYFPSMVLSGLGVACVFPQLSSIVAQALPKNRMGVGGAALQAVRQFGGTFGVALTIAFLGAATGLDSFNRIWMLIIAGGLFTSVVALLTRTAAPARLDPQPTSVALT